MIVMTGGSGLIGTRLQKALVKNYRVVCLDIQEPKARVPGSVWMKVDMTDDASVKAAVTKLRHEHGGRVASVIHLAAYYDFSGEPSPLYHDLTVEGTRRLIRGLQGLDVEQFIFSSSLLVHKPVEETGAKLTADSPTRAEWDYPRSKLAAEKVLRKEHGDIPVVVLRLAGVYDEGGHSLPITQQIRRINEKQLESYVFPGDKTHGQPFIHLDDVTACVMRVVEARDRLGPYEVYLVAEPEVMSHAALQERLGELIHGKAWPAIRIPKPVAKAGAWVKDKLPGQDPFIKPWMIDLADDHYPVEIRRLRETFQWEPKHRLSMVLEDMVARLQRDPRGFYEANGLPLPKAMAETCDARR